jgi:hypothetical protein
MCGSPADQEVGPRGIATGYLYSDAACRRSSTSSEELTHGPRLQSGNNKDPANDRCGFAEREQALRERVRIAEVCLKSFKLDRVSGSSPSDIVQVTVRLQNLGDEEVEYNVTTNYSGGAYTGEVTVLVIADVEERPIH